MFDQESNCYRYRYRYMHVFGWKYDGLCKAIAGILGNTELEVRTAPVAAGHSVNR